MGKRSEPLRWPLLVNNRRSTKLIRWSALNVNSLWTLGTLAEFSISTSELWEIEYLWFDCVRAAIGSHVSAADAQGHLQGFEMLPRRARRILKFL
jgi:hypothetical protein